MKILTSGNIESSKQRFKICSTNHRTLEKGDIVVVAESPNCDNLLIRVSDLTLHSLLDLDYEYFYVEPV